MDNVFFKAAFNKFRFTHKGNTTTEDLFDLSLSDLDKIAIALHKQIESSGSVSFVSAKSTKDLDAVAHLEVVKAVIEHKLNQQTLNKAKREISAKRQKLLAIKANKQDEALEAMTEDQLDAELAKLGE